MSFSAVRSASAGRAEISGNFLPLLRERLDLGLDGEDAIEMYSNAPSRYARI